MFRQLDGFIILVQTDLINTLGKICLRTEGSVVFSMEQ